MPYYEISLDIDAPAERVWAVLSDVAAWPELTPSIDAVEVLDANALVEGYRFALQQPKLRRAIWTITGVRDGRSFRWKSVSAGVTTHADHEITDTDGGARFVLSVRQTGLLAGLVGLLMGSTTRRYIAFEADGIKRRSERPDT